MWFLEHAWLIPLIPAASFLLILFFGKRMPYKGAEIGIAALAICFVHGASPPTSSALDHVNDAEHKAEQHQRGARAARAARASTPRTAWPTASRARGRRRRRPPRRSTSSSRSSRSTRRGPGGPSGDVELHRRHAARRPRRDDAVRRHADLAARAHLQHRLRRRRPALHPLLRLPVAVHRLDARADHEREHAAAPHLLGAGRPLLVRAHRPLVGGEAQLRRRPQGLHHQPRRRRRPHLRRDHPVLRRRPDLRHRHDQRDGRDRRDQPPRAARGVVLAAWRP